MNNFESKYKYVNGRKMVINQKNILDQYFTKSQIASELYKDAIDIISKYEDINKYVWIEPSVGESCFFDLLPKDKKIGIDIEPKRNDVIKSDFLQYKFPNQPTIVIGNPPFGHRGVLALEFIQHSKEADFICFILPMFFESKGKGSIKYRINKEFNLLYSKQLPQKSFYTPDGNDADVKCVFQIWSRKHKIENKNDFSWYSLKENNPFEKFVSLYTVSTAKNRECGKKWIHEKKANYYLSSTFFKSNSVVGSFKDVKYGSGIAIVYNTSDINVVKKLDSIFKNANWNKYSSLATNSCRHIGKAHIYELLWDNNILNEEW
ncbi:hypothetical protein NPA07_04205 [Mycoplasmopsis caviae]|uniref:SAM-dependent methyltransferase n=1 Tax=Mycoplasmopsis caviae TaxID=55603 RepID=A0A3P8LB36_9BACT|nr:SAM-dependent methyltransferase [Mycoplasmopsis caviae]UUD34984.1 hypothetical protein NPA07_04205 [Mycoplasmopsis caviae]VDR42191.1 Uncharacterised protein [Mycoplasmopsis caviae]